MSEATEVEIDRLHKKLEAIYRRGALTREERREASFIWARIERLESVLAAVVAREARG